MPGTKKMACSFPARKLIIGVDRKDLARAMFCCLDRGLLPEMCTYDGQEVVFSVLVPILAEDDEKIYMSDFLREVAEFNGSIIRGEEVNLIRPPAHAPLHVGAHVQHPRSSA